MKAAPNGHQRDPRRPSIEDLRDPARAAEALVAWESLEPALLTAIESHPQHGPRLAMLRRVDLWLQSRDAHIEGGQPEGSLGGKSSPEVCPEPGELYDYGRGPGYGPLTNARRTEIERHLARCRECEAAVETLATPPPVPLDVVTVPRREAGRESLTGRRPLLRRTDRPRLLPIPRLVPLAVAASVVVLLGLWIAIVPSGPGVLTFPEAPLLRGSSGGPLYFPRERVLLPSPEAAAVFPALRGGIVFELEPIEGASSYRVELERQDGDPFASEGVALTRVDGEDPILRATLDLEPALYTWSATATVRGLDKPLGARDFVAVEDADVSAELASFARYPEAERGLAAVRLLHAHGFLADARAVARAMPPSPERDAYLGRVPGR